MALGPAALGLHEVRRQAPDQARSTGGEADERVDQAGVSVVAINYPTLLQVAVAGAAASGAGVDGSVRDR